MGGTADRSVINFEENAVNPRPDRVIHVLETDQMTKFKPYLGKNLVKNPRPTWQYPIFAPKIEDH